MSQPPHWQPGPPMSYPPYPPRQSMPGWAWGLIGGLIGGAVVFLAVAVLPIILVIAFTIAFAEDLGLDDYLVDDATVVDATEPSCRAMVEAGESVPAIAAPEAAATALTTYAGTVTAIATAIDRSGTDDTDSRDWRDDLLALAGHVDDAAQQIRAGSTAATFDLGREDRLLQRLDFGSPVDCEIPATVTRLDPAQGPW